VEHFRDVERPKGAERRRKCGTTAHLRVDFRRAPTGCRDGRLPTKGRAVDPEAADVGLAPRRDGRLRSRDCYDSYATSPDGDGLGARSTTGGRRGSA